MKQFIIGTMVLVFISIASIKQTAAQPRFEVPLRFADGVFTQMLYFGILPGGHFCIDPSDTINGHGEQYLPPIPPGAVFDLRFICPRSNCGLSCFDQGSPCDFRPFMSTAQKDTFKFRFQFFGGTPTLCWPSGLSAYFTELRMDSVNMLIDTCVAFGPYYPFVTGRIYSGGLVTSVGQASPSVAERFALHQNYPNPFNPSTKIVYRVGSRELVSLRVFDLLGREVVTLVDEEQGSGEHSVEWTPAAVSSGVYIYRLITSGGTLARQMLLLR
jgi:hypothetical protein